MSWIILDNESFRDLDPDLETNLETGLGLKFGNLSKPTYTSIEQTRVNLINLLLTTKGERVYLPNFGTDLLRIIFEPNQSNIRELISFTISEAIAYWLPFVIIQDLSIETADETPNLNHQVLVKLTWTINELETDTIEFVSDGNNVSVE